MTTRFPLQIRHHRKRRNHGNVINDDDDNDINNNNNNNNAESGSGIFPDENDLLVEGGTPTSTKLPKTSAGTRTNNTAIPYTRSTRRTSAPSPPPPAQRKSNVSLFRSSWPSAFPSTFMRNGDTSRSIPTVKMTTADNNTGTTAVRKSPWSLPDHQRRWKSRERNHSRFQSPPNQEQQQSAIPSDLAILWSDYLTPQSSAELVVAPKKVNEVIQWMQGHIASNSPISQKGLVATTTNNNSQSHRAKNSVSSSSLPPPKLLILVGSPGIGKSTMIRVLCRERNVALLEWNESFYSASSVDSLPTTVEREESGGHGDWRMTRMTAPAFATPLQSFQQFLEQCGVGYTSLSFTTINKQQSQQQPQHDKMNSTMILIDAIPHLHTTEQIVHFQRILHEHVLRTVVPTVFIISDTVEGKCQELETKYLPAALLQTPLVQIIPIQPPTKVRFEKFVVERARRFHSVGSKSLFHSAPEQPWNEDRLSELYDETGGDVRAALTTLQMWYPRQQSAVAAGGLHVSQVSLTSKQKSGNNRRRRRGRDESAAQKRSADPSTISSDCGSMQGNQKGKKQRNEPKLSTFHALGKLLYAKRGEKASLESSWTTCSNATSRPPLAFDPETVLEQAQYSSLGSVLRFLHYHSVAFYTDIENLSDAFHGFSDVAMLSDHASALSWDPVQRQSVYPEPYMISWLSRTVATTNLHPVQQHAFRSLHAPPNVFLKCASNAQRLGMKYRFVRGASCTGTITTGNVMKDEDALSALRWTIRPERSIAVDLIPYLRKIHPYDEIPLESHLGGDMNHLPNSMVHATIEDEQEQLWREQQVILEADDIVDSD